MDPNQPQDFNDPSANQQPFNQPAPGGMPPDPYANSPIVGGPGDIAAAPQPDFASGPTPMNQPVGNPLQTADPSQATVGVDPMAMPPQPVNNPMAYQQPAAPAFEQPMVSAAQPPVPTPMPPMPPAPGAIPPANPAMPLAPQAQQPGLPPTDMAAPAQKPKGTVFVIILMVVVVLGAIAAAAILFL